MTAKFARLVGEPVENPSTVYDIGPCQEYGVRFQCYAIIYRGPCRYCEVRQTGSGKKAFLLAMWEGCTFAEPCLPEAAPGISLARDVPRGVERNIVPMAPPKKREAEPPVPEAYGGIPPSLVKQREKGEGLAAHILQGA